MSTNARDKKKEFRLKQMAQKARIKQREKSLHTFSTHLKQGTFPKRMKSIKPYPKMETPEAQAKVNEACQQVERVILGHMVQDQAMKLKQEQESYEALRQQRVEERQQNKAQTTDKATQSLKPSKKDRMTVTQLQQELRDMQAKYTALCAQVGTPQ